MAAVIKPAKKKKHKKKVTENKENDNSDDQFKLKDVISLGGTQVSCFVSFIVGSQLVFNLF